MRGFTTITVNNIRVTQSNRQIKQLALFSLRGRWGEALSISLVYSLLSSLPSFLLRLFPEVTDGFDMPGFVLSCISAALTGALTMGLCACFLRIFRQQPVQGSDFAAGFSVYPCALILGLVQFLFSVMTTQGLFVSILAIVSLLSYALAYFVRLEDENKGPFRSLSFSRYLMMGNKSRLAGLLISFAGWFILISLVVSLVQFLVCPNLLTELMDNLQAMELAENAQAMEKIASEGMQKVLAGADNIWVQLVQLVLDAVLTVYIYTSLACFYDFAAGNLVMPGKENVQVKDPFEEMR